MTSTPLEQRLSKITTNWDDLIDAHSPDAFDLRAAQQRGEILKRYSDCVYQYILGATRCPHAADDLSQDFALRFIRGDFRNANPAHGRFRDYLKRSLRNLITDFFRRQQTNNAGVNFESVEGKTIVSLESAFTNQWRSHLLGTTWASLKSHERKSGSKYFSVLHMRAEKPAAKSEDLAKEFSVQHDRHVSADWIRQTLRRARRKFADILVEEVNKTLASDSQADLDDELASLGLQKYFDDRR